MPAGHSHTDVVLMCTEHVMKVQDKNSIVRIPVMSLIAAFFLLCYKAMQLVEHVGSLIDSHDVYIQSIHSCQQQDTERLVKSMW